MPFCIKSGKYVLLDSIVIISYAANIHKLLKINILFKKLLQNVSIFKFSQTMIIHIWVTSVHIWTYLVIYICSEKFIYIGPEFIYLFAFMQLKYSK